MIRLEELILYWRGELSTEREDVVEQALFEDASTARRLDAIAQLDAGLRNLIAAGKLQSTVTVEALEGLKRSGLQVRIYRVAPAETIPCTIAWEEFVAIRLAGDFAGMDRVDVVMDGIFEGLPPASESYQDVLVDRRMGEVVLLYPGDRIRALPRSQFRYTVSGGRRRVGQYVLDHTPPR